MDAIQAKDNEAFPLELEKALNQSKSQEEVIIS